jgi:hypothetical protein
VEDVMKNYIKTSRMILLGCTIAAVAVPATAQNGPPAVTAQTLIDRAQIQDMLARYMNDLGRAGIETYLTYYADDAELSLGGKSYKGRDAISGAYAAARAASGNTRSSAYAFNTLLNNPIIVVRGDTATVQLIFTEVLVEKPQSPPRILVQGREYDELVRANGQWLFKKRQVVGGSTPPTGWHP